MGRFIDITDQQFGRLTACWPAGIHQYRNSIPVINWLCLCECGVLVLVPRTNLGRSTKGCRRCQYNKLSGIVMRHGHAMAGQRSPTHSSWHNMLDRCNNPNRSLYKNYGGRGIKVCDRWQGDHGFENFLADMGERPLGKSIDRYPNNDGNYESSNCRWATRKEQNLNRREVNNKVMTVRDLR